MEKTFNRTKFFDGIAFLFNQFFEYFKLFLLTILNTIAISIIGIVPFVGWIASLVLSILTIMFIPFGVVNIVCGIKINFHIYSDFFDFLPRAFTKPIIMQLIKMILVGVAAVAICVIFFVGSFAKGNLDMILGSLISVVPLIMIVLIMETKMTVTLNLLIVSIIYEDYDIQFFHAQKNQYKCMFLWLYVPLINLIAAYVFATIFAIDVKDYYEL